MAGDPLERLLREADASAGEPAVPDGLAVRVRRLAQRRRAVRRGAWAAAVVMAAIAATIYLCAVRETAGPSGAGPAAPPSVSRAEAAGQAAQMARLEADAQAAMDRVAYLETAERRRALWVRLRRLAAQPDAGEAIELEIDRAAFLTIYRADRLARDVRARADAVRAYRQVIELYPETRWAVVARERLVRLESPQGGLNHESRRDAEHLSGLDRRGQPWADRVG